MKCNFTGIKHISIQSNVYGEISLNELLRFVIACYREKDKVTIRQRMDALTPNFDEGRD